MQPPQTKAAWEQTLDETAQRAESEVRRVIAFLNDEVVPQIRHDGTRVLRSAAAELGRLADRMERRGTGVPPGDAPRR